MSAAVDTRRILIFLAIAFGLAWATALILALTGGLADSPALAPGFSLALALLAGPYMWAPALAHILTRAITREGWADRPLRLRFGRGWRWWLAAWLLPPILIAAGGAIYYLIFPGHFDPAMSAAQEMMETAAQQAGQTLPLSVQAIVIAQLASGFVVAPLINSFFTFGEEFGWRGYLQPKLMPLGGRTALLLMGLIWGIWHAPVIAMGHNYGLEYPGAPWTGILAMVWFTLIGGTLLGWLTLRAGSVWPAVIGHAMLNGFAGAAIYFVRGEPNPLLGPLPVGVIGSLSFAAAALAIFLIPGALTPPAEPPPA